MIRSVLVVCIGNICRSPAGERLLAAQLPDFTVESAGLGALVDHAADADMAAVAASAGVSLDGHKARQFTPEMAREYDLILVMEPEHKATIARQAPQLSGKVMLFDQWTGGNGIADPYRRSVEFHKSVYEQIETASLSWAKKLGGF